MAKREYQERNGKQYETKYIDTNAETVYEDLSHELIAKKICGCTWIKRIERVNMYDGTERITVTYDHGGRSVYTVSAH